MVQAILPVPVATFLLNEKRTIVAAIEKRQKTELIIIPNPYMETPNYEINRLRKSDAFEGESYTVPNQPELEIVTTSQDPTAGKPVEQAAVSNFEMPTPPAPKPVEKVEVKKPGLLSRIWSGLFGDGEDKESKDNKPDQHRGHRNRNNRNQNRNRNNRNRNSRNRNRGKDQQDQQAQDKSSDTRNAADKQDNRGNKQKPVEQKQQSEGQNRGNRSPRGNRNARNDRNRGNQRKNTDQQDQQKAAQDNQPRPERKSRDERRKQVDPKAPVESVNTESTAAKSAVKPVNTPVAKNQAVETKAVETRPVEKKAEHQKTSPVDTKPVEKKSAESAASEKSAQQQPIVAEPVNEKVSKAAEVKPVADVTKVITDKKTKSEPLVVDTKVAEKAEIEPKATPVVTKPVQVSVPRKSYSAMAKANNPEPLVIVDFGFSVKVYAEGELVTANWVEPENVSKSYSPMTKPNLEELMAE